MAKSPAVATIRVEIPRTLTFLSTVMNPQQQPSQSVPDSEVRFRLLFENSMDGILLTSPDGRIFDANPSACSILGRTREQIVAAGREGIMDASDPALPRLVEERKRTGKAHGEMTALRPDGEPLPIEMSSVVFSDVEGSQFTCIIFRDISKRKRAEAERERLLAELTEALARIKTLTGLLPICAHCKKIRDEAGNWTAIERYVRDRTEANFSHGICPECARQFYPEHYKKT
jgi:PAS domain S-box-containing protein